MRMVQKLAKFKLEKSLLIDDAKALGHFREVTNPLFQLSQPLFCSVWILVLDTNEVSVLDRVGLR